MRKYEPRHKKDNSRRTALRKKRLKNGRVFATDKSIVGVDFGTGQDIHVETIVKISWFRKIINFIKKLWK